MSKLLHVEDGLLWLVLVSYAAASVFYLSFMARRRQALAQTAASLTLVGFVLHSVAFALYWIRLGRPPFGGINEVMISFAWALVLINLVVDRMVKFKFVNFIALPMATIAVFLTTVFPSQKSGFLVPALQSYWLYIHVSLAMLAYSTLAISFAVAVLYLVKDNVKVESFGIVVMGLVTLLYLSVNESSIPTQAAYHLAGFENGQTIMSASKTPLRIEMPGVGPILLIAFIFSALAFVTYLISQFRNRAAYSRWAAKFVAASMIGQAGGLLLLLYGIASTPRVSFSSNPIELTWLIAALIITLIFYGFLSKRDRIAEFLPDKSKLDDMTYRIVTAAFPMLSLMIITGAVWAGQAWGRYWAWDPKETWALITWLIYSGYLHARVTRGWAGRRAAYLAVLGFACVVFTYLGVTYLLSGLHSYK